MALKARAAENAVKAALEYYGRVVHQAVPHYQRLKNGKVITRTNDIYGVFDLIAMATSASGIQEPLLWLVQVTTTGGVSARKNKVAAWLRDSEVRVNGAVRVSIIESRERKDDLAPAEKYRYGRIHDYVDGGWGVAGTIELKVK